MAGTQQTLDPTKVTLIFDGVQIKQFAKGTKIKVTMEADAFSDEVGADGDVVRLRSADRRGTIEFTLMAGSPSNDYLSAKLIADRLAGGGVGEAQVKDGTGTSIHHAANAWLKKMPDAEYTTEPGMERAWMLRCAKLESYVGGTTDIE